MMSDTSMAQQATAAMTKMTHGGCHHHQQHPRSPSWIDGMAEVAAKAHQRQPSLMMIVLPLVEDEDAASVRCDDLNASIYDFDDCFQQQQEREEDSDDDDDDDHSEHSSDEGIPRTITMYREDKSSSFSSLQQEEEEGQDWAPLAAPAVPLPSQRVESPRCVTAEMMLSTAAVTAAAKIPVLTDLMKSTTLSTCQKLRHKRSRNRAMSDQDFGRSVLPQLYGAGGTAA